MTLEHSGSAPEPRLPTADSRWITGVVALLAICVFTISGAEILPAIFFSSAGLKAVGPNQIAAFLLNIALVLFAWRRSVQLRETAAERDVAENLAYRFAYYDELTGLLNRRRFNEVLSQTCAKRSSKLALVLIDLDRFKRVNDLHGHSAGDQLLITTANRLLEHCPPDASCFRIGGDEFAVVLQGTPAQAKEARQTAQDILAALGRPVIVGNSTTAIAASLGIALISKQCNTPAMLIERADLAMYRAKRLGRNRCEIFGKGMEAEHDQRRRFEAEMREGIASGEFVPYFQPIFDLASGDVTGFEVLARWRHPERGLLEPPEFIDVAEQTAMISELSFGVMFEALTIARDWPSHYKIAVNVSPVQFSDPLTAQRIMQILTVTGFPPARLELEIMERSLLEDLDLALATITSLKNSGVTVSVDDFGTGYASIAKLKMLPFDRIKIDRDYIASLLDDSRSDALVEAIAALGKGLRIPITAEGVEAESLRSRLMELGCSDAQGWVFAKALSANEVRLGFADKWAAALPLLPLNPAPLADERKIASA